MPSEKIQRQLGEAELIEREVFILQSLADGKTYRELSAELGINEFYISVHMKRIVRKLGVPNRTAAVALALRQGIID